MKEFLCRLHKGLFDEATLLSHSFVIPAKAGIHHLCSKFQRQVMDPRLRGGDEGFEW
jgi:hypothetical protein